MEWFGKLKAFKERFGHCNVEAFWTEDLDLGRWVSHQRTRRNKGLLSSEQIQVLDEIGFVWDYQTQKSQTTWMKWYRELESYARQYGNPHVPRTHANIKLASWVWIQRGLRKKSSGEISLLTNEQIFLLNKLGFRWDAREAKWTERLEQLKQFKEQHGHCKVGLVADEDDELLVWVRKQRAQLSSGKLVSERKAKLDALGSSWATDEGNIKKWNDNYDCLKAYHTEHGNADVPSHWKSNPVLAAWVSHQRQNYKKRLMPDEQIQLLQALGFTWQHRERGSWDDRLAEVVAFKATNGHCDMPVYCPENPKLGRFVNATRTQRNSGRLPADRIAKLDALGFVWGSSRTAEVGGEGINGAWKTRFDELLCYKEEKGHCNVPAKCSSNPQLANWVGVQRHQKRKGSLHPKREEMLNSIGFQFEPLTGSGIKKNEIL